MPHDASLGRSHPLVQQIKLLARSPEERQRAGLMVVEGVHLAKEALAEGALVRHAVVGERLERGPEGRRIMDRLRRTDASIHHASGALLESLHEAESHQGVLLVVQRPETSLDGILHGGRTAGPILIAWAVQDPGNAGALVRIADASGAIGLIAVSGADPFSPKAARGSAGSIFRLPVLRLSRSGDGLELAGELRRRGLRLVGSAPRGGADYRVADLSAPIALFVGGEGAGLPEPIDRQLDMKLTIPMSPRVESINVAAAAAVLLFSASAQRALRLSRGPGGAQTPARPGGRPGRPPARPPRAGPAGGSRRRR